MPVFRHTPHAVTAVRRLPAGGLVDPHLHDDHQIVYAGRGVLSVSTDSGSWIAPATRAIWVPAGTVHQHRAHGVTDLHTVGLPATENPLGLEHPAVLEVTRLCRELLLAYTADPADDGPERRRLRAVLLDQLRHAPQHPLHLPSPTDARLIAVRELLEEDPADDRRLAELGAQIGASERTLSRLFRKEMGMTFPRWRTQLRLHHALLLLADDVPVTVVGRRCGWSSTSAFIDAFRQTFGHPPGAHRAHQGQPDQWNRSA